MPKSQFHRRKHNSRLINDPMSAVQCCLMHAQNKSTKHQILKTTQNEQISNASTKFQITMFFSGILFCAVPGYEDAIRICKMLSDYMKISAWVLLCHIRMYTNQWIDQMKLKKHARWSIFHCFHVWISHRSPCVYVTIQNEKMVC